MRKQERLSRKEGKLWKQRKEEREKRKIKRG